MNGALGMEEDEYSVLGDPSHIPEEVWERSIVHIADESAEADMSLIPDSGHDVGEAEFDSDPLNVDESDPGDARVDDDDGDDDGDGDDFDAGDESDGWDD